MINIDNYIINCDFTIKQAMKSLDAGGIGFLCIYKDDKVFGVITDGDIRRAILNEVPLGNIVGEITNTAFFSLNEYYEKEEVNKLFKYTHIKHIPVINSSQQLIEIITEETFYNIKITKKQKKIDAKVVIMAGGKGTRLMPFTKIIPKPLIPIGDKSMLEIIMNKYNEYNIYDFYISVNYKASMIKAYFEDIDHQYSIKYVEEDKPLGTAGALKFLENEFDKPFFVANCDIVIKADYDTIYDFHINGKYDITLVASMQNYKIPYGICEIKKGGELKAIKEKPEYNFLVNTGMYILSPSILKYIPENEFFHITHLIEIVKFKGGKIGVYPVSEKSWIDIGQMDEYKKNLDILTQ